jgi:vitamin B12 transporter
MRKIVLIILWVVVLPGVACAQDTLKTQTLQETVVIGTKFSVPVEKSGKVIVKIGADRLQQGENLADVLNGVPGIQMDGNFGTPGTNISYYVRGGRSKQTLILLDGVPMNDPSGIDPFYDLRFVSTSQLDHVEILQGGLSTLYGSGASASVINVQTKNSGQDGIHGAVGLQAGSWDTYGQNINLNGKQDKFSFLVLGSNLTSKGFSSAAGEDAATSFDKDGFKKRNGLLKLGYQFNASLKAEIFGGIDWFDAEYDAGAFVDGTDAQRQKQNKLGARIIQSYTKGSLTLTAQHTDLTREITGSYPTQYDGSNWFAELVHKHELSSRWTILSGLSFQRLSYDEKEAVSKDTTSFIIIDPYTSLMFSLPSGFTVHGGIRLNYHSDYGSKVLYNVNPSWLIDVTSKVSLKPFVSVSTSYITPTLFQLHTPWGGNINLNPEESINYEYGLSLYLADKFSLTAVNFFREEKQVIGYTVAYENVSEQRTVKGVTVDVQYKPIQILTVTGNFSWVTSDDQQSFYRIPARKAGLGVHLTPVKSGSVSLRYQYTSQRTDLYYDEFFNANDVELSAYSIVDLNVSYRLFNDHLTLTGAVYNLADEDFIGVYGYTTRGRNYSIGVSYNF